MIKHVYLCKETINFPSKTDIRSGEYYMYRDYDWEWLFDSEFVFNNHLFGESEWILNNWDKSIERDSGHTIYIPTPKVAKRIDDFRALLDDYDDKSYLLSC